jgi:hypothetical protein
MLAILGLGVMIAGSAILAGLLVLATVVGTIVLAAVGIRTWFRYRASNVK